VKKPRDAEGSHISIRAIFLTKYRNMIDPYSQDTEQEQIMAAARTLKAAKKELRALMKEKLPSIPKESLDEQSV
jgi:hypothetical protein